ncbi:hypothetical protein D1AOALGA4SA_7104 [Olavius algarvensis Delta 1 endosymbiont]|nr:hypothetical protein D1AOALGA4SA_7104 [Olavius algarvensis Delta 1 endosymbiont]
MPSPFFLSIRILADKKLDLCLQGPSKPFAIALTGDDCDLISDKQIWLF